MSCVLKRRFDLAFCINLDRRPDRWAAAQEQFHHHGLEVMRISAVPDSQLLPDKLAPKYPPLLRDKGKVPYCIMLTHLLIFRLAEAMKLTSFVVFEDDVRLSKNFRQDAERFLKDVPDDWDMIYFGGSKLLNMAPVPHRTGIFRPSYMYFTHAYGAHKRVYKKCIEAMLSCGHEVDQLLAGLHPQMRVYTPVPALAVQDRGLGSDNRK